MLRREDDQVTILESAGQFIQVLVSVGTPIESAVVAEQEVKQSTTSECAGNPVACSPATECTMLARSIASWVPGHPKADASYAGAISRRLRPGWNIGVSYAPDEHAIHQGCQVGLPLISSVGHDFEPVGNGD